MSQLPAVAAAPTGRTFRPVRWGELAVLAAVVALVSFGVTASQLTDWGPSLWTITSADFRQVQAIAGPLIAAWLAFSARLRFTAACGRVPGRGYASITINHLGRLWLAAATGLVVGLLPVVIRTALRATAGGPDWLVIVSGLAQTAAWAACGYLVGAVLRYPYSVALALLGSLALVFLLAGLGYEAGGGEWRILAPWWNEEVYFAEHELPAVSAFRCLEWLALAGACAWALSWLDERSQGRWRRLGQAAVAFVAPAALMAGGLAVNPWVFADDDQASVECVTLTSGSNLCLYQEASDLLPLAQEAVDGVIDQFGDAALKADFGPDWVLSHRRGDSQATVRELVQGNYVGAAVFGETSCALPDGTPTDASQLQSNVYSSVTGRLAGQEQVFFEGAEDTAMVRLATMTDAELKAWLTTNGPALRACQLTDVE